MLKGERVTLRGITREDLPLVWRFNNDLAVELAGGGDPPMPQSFERVVADFERQAASGGRDGAVFAIEVDGAYIGICGLSNFNETSHTCELGIAIGDTLHWGQGYGREAVSLLLEYAFRYRNFRRVWLWAHADNERGIRAYQSCGFVEEGRLRQHVYSNGRYDDAVYMGVLREEWEAPLRRHGP
ncbi:MAG TPA: GNAT family protein [Thermomicrobiales bacterium]|nr:GNAT family protein [Thermomicrobiales bacterium]